MANETYTLIQKTTLNANAASITFSSIPQTFTDLVVKMSVRGLQAGVNSSCTMQFNGSSTNFTMRRLYGSGSVAASDAPASSQFEAVGATATANTFANIETYISNYTSANYKSVSRDTAEENNATASYILLDAVLWSNTAAITSISFHSTDNFVQYCTFSLYGVAKFGVNPVAGPKASGGDIITNDGTYWIHQFLNSGTFTPSQTLSTEYLVVAGGGACGNAFNQMASGGGGAGGYLTNVGGSPLSATAQAYTIQVGAGGSIGTTGAVGGSGTNSIYSSITATGGGGGGFSIAGGSGSGDGAAGGSGGGGGAGETDSSASSGGTASPSGQGNAGGAGGGTSISGSGGGGGAGSVGSANSTSSGGNGGTGLSSSITGTAVSRGGGGGGAGAGYSASYHGGTGVAGGGTGGEYSGGVGRTGTAGTVNTGGGAGGANGTAGAAGGSGIVIIRYAI